MNKNKGGFREGVTISKKIKEAQDKMNATISYILKKILNENYIFLTGTTKIMNVIMDTDNLEIGVIEVEGKDIEIGDKSGSIEKLFVTKKKMKILRNLWAAEILKS